MRKIFGAVIAASLILSCVSAVFASDADIAALEETAEYFSGGVTADGDLKNHTASNGTEVTLTWSGVYDNTVADEKGSYSGSAYLSENGNITIPEWYEGTKKLKATAQLAAGEETRTVPNVNISIPPKTAPDFTSAFENGLLTDYIDIGNPDSETVTDGVNTVKRLECVRDNGIQTNTVDGTEHTYRTLNKNGAMVVTMKCSGEKTNYLTVKLWGDDTGDTMLWVCDPISGNMNLSNSRQPTRNGIVDRRDWVELNFLNSSPQYNGGFIYSTYIIPEIYTKGREYVSLRIYSTGGNANYNNVTIKDQTMPSRGIYAAYMTRDADFNPSDFEEITGGLVKTAESAPLPYDEQKTLALTYAKDAVETFKSWQIYGQNNYPSYMEGMVTRSTAWQTKNIDDTDWKDCYYSGMMKQNLTPLNMYELFASAYENAKELGYNAEEKAELLDRTVKGIDFLVRAQGSNGGFYSEKTWIGAPDRQAAAGNNLTGFGLRSVAKAMIMICADVDFTEEIDSDADGAADMTRFNAWESMAAAARDYLVSLDGCGHAPNQDMADIIAALRFDKALKLMGSNQSWTEDEVENYLDIALGFKINKACSSYWVSPKGLILENFGSIQGGWAGDYGTEALEEMSQLVEFAEEYYADMPEKSKKYTDLLEKAYDAVDKYMFTANAEVNDNPTLYAEGLTGNRNAYYPGTERYILDEYTAVEKRNKTALKTYELFLKHNKLSVNAEAYTPSNSHFEDNAIAAMKLYLNFGNITSRLDEENISNYNYLMEDDSVTEYAWADEMARSVVIKNGTERIYLALNWRNPLHSKTYYNIETQNQQKSVMNNLARVHHTTDSYDKYGYAAMETEGWSVQTAETSEWQLFDNHYVEAFMYMNYGDYAVIMNSNNLIGAENNDTAYDIPAEKLGLNGLYKDLISGNYYWFGDKVAGAEDGSAFKVSGASTLVLYKVDIGEVKIKMTDYKEGNVTVELVKDGSDAENVCVYAAEYDKSGTLAGLGIKTQSVSSNTTISFPYKMVNESNKIRIFVWNENMKPYGWKR